MPVVHDSLVIFRRHLRLSLRSPVWIAVGLCQPVVFLLFFGPLMTRTLQLSGTPSANAWQVYVPGVLVQLALFGGSFVGFTVIAEWRAGIVERLRVTPVSRLALLLGRVMRDVVVMVLQATLLVIVAVPLGLRAPLVGVLVGLGFVGLIGLSLTSLSYALGLVLRSEETMGPVLNIFLVVLMLLSGVLLPMSLAPSWLDVLSRATPFRYVVDALRDGVSVAEFPTTLEAARGLHQAGIDILMGAPNVVRGGSHSGNIAAVDLAREGLLDILSSDYIPSSLLMAALQLPEHVPAISLPAAVRTVTKAPAEAVGLSDRGEIAVGKRADLIRVHVAGSVPVVRSVWREGGRVA